MKFQKGQSGNLKGKPKGTESKKTKVLNNFIQVIIEDNNERFNQEFKALKGKAYTDTYISLLEYVKPKLARVAVHGDPDNPIAINITFTE